VHKDKVLIYVFLTGGEVEEVILVSETLSELVQVVVDVAAGVVTQHGEAG
jgi:hypothetical protein